MTPKQKRVMRVHYISDGLTDVEMVEILGGSQRSSTMRTRRRELLDAGFIRDTGIKRVHDGREHTVWELTEKGKYYGNRGSVPRE